MMKVGRDYIQIGSKRRRLSYKDIDYKKEWIDCIYYLPADYDLMFVKTIDDKVLSGWSVGDKWIGLKIKPTDRILSWKKQILDYEAFRS